MISIAMTTYNGEKFLREQLDSILRQTYTDFELIICDDCSTDGTWKILAEYEKKDGRIQIHQNESNLGFKKNFEKTISFCNGEYIAFCDQDDVWEDFKLQMSLDNIGTFPLLCTNSTVTDSKLNPLGYTLKDSIGLKKIPQSKDDLIKNLIHHNFVQGTTLLCNSEFIKRHLPIPGDIIFHDWYFALWAAVENDIKYLDTPTVKYRQHNTNVTDNYRKTFLKKLLTVNYNREKVLTDAKNNLCLIKIAIENENLNSMKKYFEDSIKYYESLPEKKGYTIKYVGKYFQYMEWDYSKIKKYVILMKRTCAMIWFKMFIRRKNIT